MCTDRKSLHKEMLAFLKTSKFIVLRKGREDLLQCPEGAMRSIGSTRSATDSGLKLTRWRRGCFRVASAASEECLPVLIDVGNKVKKA